MLSSLIQLLRPKQWTKNLICFAGVIFGGHLREPDLVLRALLAFAAFCAAASSVYVLNDLADITRDQAHPRKRYRPLASGAVAPGTARMFGSVLAFGALLAGAMLNWTTCLCLLTYLSVNVAYSWRLKHQPIVDVCCIAFGFCLRMFGGVLALPAQPTPWIALCTFFLALFIGFGKRRAELVEVASTSDVERRPVLASYSIALLDSFLNSSSTIALMSYALFTVSSGRNSTLVLTVPLAAFVVMHFNRRVTQGVAASTPDELLLRDRPLQVGIGLWLLTYIVILYGKLHVFD